MEGLNKGKGKVLRITGHEGSEGEWRYGSALCLTSALNGGGWSTPRPRHFTPGKDPVHIVEEAGWAPEPVWTGAENVAPTYIRSPARPVHSKSLYRQLSWPTSKGCVHLFNVGRTDLYSSV